MAININNLNNTNQVKQKVEQQVQTKQQVSESANASQQAKLAPRDSVSITPQAKQMTELQKKAADAPVLNQKKIAELKSAIASGDYKINPEKLAASIANFEFELN
ncbi:flagellar biosynthesis anti-sigma factor FlgM [Cognaticolwellia beringensis]|uniref:Negative regulator of flagellin synthesis n=1 Tax=Cognaticolwellia beringensis TaxID=1967665 RepID=A0A222G496_9GAMM|nr:flagellar biosynthesis anti-sigma factor FlgM [Cognaticolwellia beringensis]ASP46562.1 flagellar biosynthesis anti-sigma factor FlgM [Cognaticolwellia beringensis]|tara:strand:+ start:2775 stop:3089 length:315 start_codon:yes stop_codon:yes gene_type:complete